MPDIIKPKLEYLSDYMSWYKTNNTSLLKYATIKLTPDVAVAVTKLFFPNFILYRNSVLLEDRFEKEGVDDWFKHFEGNSQNVEKLLNTLEVGYHLFYGIFDEQPYDNIAYIGQYLVKSWRYQLQESFPERKFEVIGRKHEDLDDYVISFWQIV